ncbi:DNA cytosine methyltransferase [Hydrogenophaga defluvii]|uniref:DNA cytosine methyltransferase n=1 Tax=Hydrogenophaga defluvii TaxID=249410 RepID=A0ABW2SBE2_9BURK
MTTTVEIRHFHFFCGLGGGARGFNRASPRVGNLQARFRCIGGIDVDAGAIRDFDRLADAPGTVMDLFDRDQYRDFHGREPGPDWCEAMPADIQRAAGNERPHIVFLSAPCKGFSGLLAEGKSKTDKYQALNCLTLRGVWLMLEAWAGDPPELIIFENVPRIATRGRHLLDQIVDLLRAYGYAVAETTHDCGEIGGLAQSRKRFLLVARHAEKVPAFLYEPTKRPLRAVGDILGKMPLPGSEVAGPMHRVPALQWKTWVRLAFVEAGSDWRSLNKLAVENGHLRDFLIVPDMHAGVLGVNEWDRHAGTVTSRGMPNNGKFSVADPRFEQSALWKDGQALGVRSWEESTGTIAGQQNPGQGAYSVADPRHTGPAKHSNEFHIIRWDRDTGAVTSAHGSGQCVADPRQIGEGFGKYAVTPFNAHAGTVISGSTTGQGAFAVADPRSGIQRGRGDNYLTAGHYGVVPWADPAGAVSAAAGHDNGRWSVADPRVCDSVQVGGISMPALAQKLVCRIRALDGTWHRPFTTLELAALQSLLDPEDTWMPWQLDGESDQAYRERIGNAVPSNAAMAIADVMGTTLLLAMSGETFVLSAQPVWVRPLALALAVNQPA